jgi:hypothetical protein
MRRTDEVDSIKGDDMKKMRIRIDQNGKTTVRVEGAVENECLDFTRALEKSLGIVEERVRHEDGQESQVNVEERRQINPNE